MSWRGAAQGPYSRGNPQTEGVSMSTEAIPVYIRPPGALPDDEEFMDTCLRCAACVAACPYGALEEVGFEDGRAVATPHLLPENVPCPRCETRDCAEVCMGGALTQL